MTSYFRSRQQKSPTYQVIFGIQRGCEQRMQRILELLSEANVEMGGAAAAAREEQFLRAVQAKNGCYARTVCPAQYQEALQCALDEERLGAGRCGQVLDAVSSCVKAFWAATINSRVTELMQRQGECPDRCAEPVERQRQCAERWGPEASTHCAAALRDTQVCLGACVDAAAGARLQACRAAATGGGDCAAEEEAALRARVAAGRDVLLAMGFAEGDLAPPESSDSVMGVAGMVVTMGQIETQLGQRQ